MRGDFVSQTEVQCNLSKPNPQKTGIHFKPNTSLGPDVIHVKQETLGIPNPFENRTFGPVRRVFGLEGFHCTSFCLFFLFVLLYTGVARNLHSHSISTPQCILSHAIYTPFAQSALPTTSPYIGAYSACFDFFYDYRE